MKKINNRNYFVVIDQSDEMWTAVKFAIRRAKVTKSKITTVSFIQSASEGMMLTSGTEKILDKDQISTEKLKHKLFLQTNINLVNQHLILKIYFFVIFVLINFYFLDALPFALSTRTNDIAAIINPISINK